jgi:uncharacterized protein YbjT (DUF2867 family)
MTIIVFGASGNCGRHFVRLAAARGHACSRPVLNLPMRFLVATSNVGVAYADLERVETVLRESGLDWKAVRPTTLTHKPATRRVRQTERYPATATIPREDVAAFILEELERPQFSSRTPMITVT